MLKETISFLALIVSSISLFVSYKSSTNSKRAQSFVVQEKKLSILNELSSIELLAKQEQRRVNALQHDLSKVANAQNGGDSTQWINDKLNDYASSFDVAITGNSQLRALLKETDDTKLSRHNLETLMAKLNAISNTTNESKTRLLNAKSELDYYEYEIKKIVIDFVKQS